MSLEHSQLKQQLLELFNQYNIMGEEDRAEAALQITLLSLNGQPHAAIDYLVTHLEASTQGTAILEVMRVLLPVHEAWIRSQHNDSNQ